MFSSDDTGKLQSLYNETSTEKAPFFMLLADISRASLRQITVRDSSRDKMVLSNTHPFRMCFCCLDVSSPGTRDPLPDVYPMRSLEGLRVSVWFSCIWQIVLYNSRLSSRFVSDFSCVSVTEEQNHQVRQSMTTCTYI